MDAAQAAFEAWKASYDDGDCSPFEYSPQEVEDAFMAAWQAATARAIRIVMDDVMAISYQTLGQYRTGLAYHINGKDPTNERV